MKKLYVGISHWTLDNWFNYDGDLLPEELENYIDPFIERLSRAVYKHQPDDLYVEVYYIGPESIRDTAIEGDFRSGKQIRIPDWVEELIDEQLQRAL